ncbi:hypothetical protein [Ferruginibacter sp.]
MKVPAFFTVLLFITIGGYGQKVKYISQYYTQYDTASSMNCFRIGKHALSFDEQAVYLDKKVLIAKDTGSFFFLEVYSDKVLVVSYYPMSEAYVATGPGFRPLQQVEFILLDDPKQRWHFDLKGAFNSSCIVNFNTLTGELELKRKIKGKKE